MRVCGQGLSRHDRKRRSLPVDPGWRPFGVSNGTQENDQPLGKWFLNHPHRRHYQEVIFDPKPGANYKTELNLWSGWSVDRAEGDWEPFRRLILDVLCSGDAVAYDYVLNWCARMVQKPHLPGEVALVFQGDKGTGKSTFGAAMKQLAGPHGVQVTQQSHLTGKFNAHLAEKIVLFADEAFFAGDHQQSAVMKGLVTESSFLAEPKGIDAYTVDNMLHVVMASNSDWVVSADEQERRFAVFTVSRENADRFRKDIGYSVLFDERSKLKKSILAAFLHDMLARNISGWRPQEHIPQTEGLAEQRLQTVLRNPRVRWWYHVLCNVSPLNDRIKLGWQNHELIACPELKDEMVEEYEAARKDLPYARESETKDGLAKWLRKNFGYDMNARKGTQKAWRLPPLDQCRRDFERVFKVGSIDWEEAEFGHFDFSEDGSSQGL